MKVTIQLFGAFRHFGDEVAISSEVGVTVSDLRLLVFDRLTEVDPQFDDMELLSRSRFATDTEILAENTALSDNMKLAIIPPVSGG